MIGDNVIARDLATKASDDVNAVLLRVVTLVDSYDDRMAVLIGAYASIHAAMAATIANEMSLPRTDDTVSTLERLTPLVFYTLNAACGADPRIRTLLREIADENFGDRGTKFQ